MQKEVLQCLGSVNDSQKATFRGYFKSAGSSEAALRAERHKARWKAKIVRMLRAQAIAEILGSSNVLIWRTPRGSAI